MTIARARRGVKGMAGLNFNLFKVERRKNSCLYYLQGNYLIEEKGR
jgi:hypothetical protein